MQESKTKEGKRPSISLLLHTITLIFILNVGFCGLLVFDFDQRAFCLLVYALLLSLRE